MHMLFLDCILIYKLHHTYKALNLARYNLYSSISAFKIKINIVQIFPAAHAKSLLDSDLTTKRMKLLEMKR